MVARYADREGVDLIHAWGPFAAQAASAARRPVVAELFDPALAAASVKALRTVHRSRGFGVVCASAVVRRRLIEGGFPLDGCALVRPAVDFGWVRGARREPLRDALGIAPDDFVVIVPDPVTRESGAFDTVWAAALLNHLDQKVRVILPGHSLEQRRVERFAAGLPTENPIVHGAGSYAFEDMLVHSDALVVAARGDVSTTCIAWAMAAGVAVIGAATYAVAELASHKVGGLLFKPPLRGSSAPAVVRLLRDREAQAKAKEVARGQAYEVFGLRRFVEQHLRVYDNLLAGRQVGDGIVDSAQAG